MNLLVLGGAGYVGSVLVPKLLAAGHAVTVYDTFWYGNHQTRHEGLYSIEGDVRSTDRLAKWAEVQDAVIHLACVSNDPSAELDPALTRAVNLDSFRPCVAACVAAGVRRFIFASSSSVYGVSDAPSVTEEHPFKPLTSYSAYKADCEVVLRHYDSPSFATTIVRPATVCGVSPRMRFDLVANIFAAQAVTRGVITVHGGSQRRPNVHVDDLCELYLRLLDPEVLPVARGQTFNAGAENHTLLELAHAAKAVVEDEFQKPVRVEVTVSDDLRSYHIDSSKAARVLGWRPSRTVADAVRDVCRGFKAGRWPDPFAAEFVNVKAMKARANGTTP